MSDETPTATLPDLRSVDLGQLVEVLRSENARRYDVVVPATSLVMEADGNMTVAHRTEATIDESGVTPGGLEFLTVTPTIVADEQLSERTGIPRQYYRRMKTSAPSLLAENVNHWLDEDKRSFYLRVLMGDDGTPGVLRAVLSDRFRAIDDLDVLMAALEGIRSIPGLDPADLSIAADRSARRMYLRVAAPHFTVEAPDLVAGYRDPKTGGSDGKGVISAGVVIRNSDVGQGAYQIAPRIFFRVCGNGMTRNIDAVRSIHIGGQHDEGLVDWSEETIRRQLAVIASKTTDAVARFLTTDYLRTVVDEIRGVSSGKELADPLEAVQEVTRKLKTTEDETKAILAAFMKGADFSPLGVAQAFTYVAQAATADRSAELEDVAWEAMSLAAALS